MRSSPISNVDEKFYDFAKFQVFTQGQQAVGSNLGELWISYDIEFLKPRLPTGGIEEPTDRYYLTQAISGGAPLGGVIVNPAGSLGTTMSINNQSISIPANAPLGNYLVVARWQGGAAVLTAPVLSVTGSGQAKNYFLNLTSSQVSSPNNANTSINLTVLFMCNKSGTTSPLEIFFGLGGVLPTSVPAADVTVTFIDAAALDPLPTSKLTNGDAEKLQWLFDKYKHQLQIMEDNNPEITSFDEDI